MDGPRSDETVPGGTPRPDDRHTVAALVARDEATFVRLLDEWGPAMRRVARAHVPTDAIAEEVVQDTWLAVLRGVDRFEGRSSLRTWAFRILSNTAKTRGVRERRTVPSSSLSPGTCPSPEQRALAGDVGRVVADALGDLPERQRTVVMLRDVHGFEPDEVCRMLDVSEGNQRVLLHRGRAAVRLRLETFFGADARWGATP